MPFNPVSVNLQPTQITEIVKLIGMVNTENGTQTPAYAATVTPAMLDEAANQKVFLTLTGNTTIGAPTGTKVGQRLLFCFTQDATGSRTVTWNAVFKAGANGAGAASQKGATEFVFDGTHWVQIGGPLAFA